MRNRRGLSLVTLTICAVVAVPAAAGATPAHRAPAGPSAGATRADRAPAGTAGGPATAIGYGGAVSTVDADATRVGLDVLRDGGTAADAAIAAAATLGVTEPFSSGIGGGGFLTYYDARSHRVYTLDGREAAPATAGADLFVDPATGRPYDFAEARISGLSVGVPGTLATWQEALRRWGSRSLAAALRPAIGVATHGFVVDETFHGQVADNAVDFGQFTSTRALYLPDGQPPAVGSTFRNPDLARTYARIAQHGTDAFYRGDIGRDVVRTVQHPPVAADPAPGWAYPIRPGALTERDLSGYRVGRPAPTHVSYRGLDVYGMPTPSSGGSTVGEALNILERSDLAHLDRTQALHRYLEASALAFADRNRYVGADTPRRLLDELLSDRFAATRACAIDPARALPKPVAPGVPFDRSAGCPAGAGGASGGYENHTTNLTVADRWGNVVEYTLTIEQTGGNAMVVPGRGFLLNNELTDFNFTPTQGDAPDPNLPGPGKRPRSSMAPTIVLRDGAPLLAVGSPGGSTIITTVLQILLGRLDLGLDLPAAIAAPRASQRNTATVTAEPAFIAGPEGAALAGLGHTFTSTPEIGAATGIEFLGRGRLLAAAEPVRRGGGSAGVVARR
ncbi:gamma-glutamyltransferase family protein [Plantactinospora sp. KBS50]|uniref:gamma-glutamyltransferase family protein n=1 Tax=Plantactinospora sp. KBS50 TaxID=2024580 RepID=UPI000BAAA692|nr:gamma-glutamyltransferase family protein [Plantactinospora sp. KBS50]ASW54477.1 gamma-glutamyltransferase [Plantactinospora sp. KBS50]